MSSQTEPSGAGEKETLHDWRSEAAGLIRHSFWLEEGPPEKDWHMGRELSIWDRLIDWGWDPEVLNGSMEVARDALGVEGPFTMRLLWERGQLGRLRECESYWRRRRQAAERPKSPAVTDEDHHSTEKISDILRDLDLT